MSLLLQSLPSHLTLNDTESDHYPATPGLSYIASLLDPGAAVGLLSFKKQIQHRFPLYICTLFGGEFLCSKNVSYWLGEFLAKCQLCKSRQIWQIYRIWCECTIGTFCLRRATNSVYVSSWKILLLNLPGSLACSRIIFVGISLLAM